METAQRIMDTASTAARTVTHHDKSLVNNAAEWLTNTSMRWHGSSSDPAHRNELRARYFNDFTETLMGYAPATVQRLNQTFILHEADFIADSIVTHKETEETINDLIMLRKLIHGIDEIGFPGKRSLYLRGISHYEHMAQQINGDYPERRLAQGTAILRVTAYLKSQGIKNEAVEADGKRYARITDPAIRTLLTTHEDPTAFADLIINRNLTTGADIKNVLATMSTLPAPLRTGSL